MGYKMPLKPTQPKSKIVTITLVGVYAVIALLIIFNI